MYLVAATLNSTYAYKQKLVMHVKSILAHVHRKNAFVRGAILKVITY